MAQRGKIVSWQTCVAIVLALTQTAFPTLLSRFVQARMEVLSLGLEHSISSKNVAFSHKYPFWFFFAIEARQNLTFRFRIVQGCVLTSLKPDVEIWPHPLYWVAVQCSSIEKSKIPGGPIRWLGFLQLQRVCPFGTNRPPEVARPCRPCFAIGTASCPHDRIGRRNRNPADGTWLNRSLPYRC